MSQHVELLLEASLVGINSVSHTPNRMSWFEAPLVDSCQRHYGAAFFVAGDKEKIEKLRQLLMQQLEFTEVTEQAKSVLDSLRERHGVSQESEGGNEE